MSYPETRLSITLFLKKSYTICCYNYAKNNVQCQSSDDYVKECGAWLEVPQPVFPEKPVGPLENSL